MSKAVSLPKYRWASLAQDLAILTVPNSPLSSLERICEVYDIAEVDVNALLQIPEFQTLVRNQLVSLKNQGTKAGQMYRANTLSQGLSEKLYNDAINGDMEAKDSIKLLELLMKAGGVMDKEQQATVVNTQVNVAVPLPPSDLHNPKFKHLQVEAE